MAIFGCGTIANRIAASCRAVDNIELIGFASKDIEKAKVYAERYDADEYGDYDHFLNSDIDGIYIATHNPSHYELIEKCLKHHKNVICEKPMLHSIETNRKMFSLARNNGVLLMEALKSVFLPINHKVKTMIQDGTIGDIIEASASFMRNGNHPDEHWINQPETGGALKDLGSYCVGTLNYLFDCVPEIISIEKDSTDIKADTTAHLKLDYNGVKAMIDVSNSLDGRTDLTITGSKGHIFVDNFWKAGRGYYRIGEDRYDLNEEFISDFYYELKHFASLVENNIKESDIMSEKASENILAVTAE